MAENQNVIRAALLRFYHSGLVAHVGYLLTSSLGAITFFQNCEDIRKFPWLYEIFQLPCLIGGMHLLRR